MRPDAEPREGTVVGTHRLRGIHLAVGHRPQVADELGLMLEKHLLFHADSTRSGGWQRKNGRELLGKTIGIVGMGRIGKEVAVRAHAFGMKPLGHDVAWDDAFAAAHGVERAASLDDLFARSDYVSLHTNLTPATRDLVRTESIARMKPGVIVINCARGEIVNTADMAAALASGRVRGYGTDVLDVEPPPAHHPLTWKKNAQPCFSPGTAARLRIVGSEPPMSAATTSFRSARPYPLCAPKGSSETACAGSVVGRPPASTAASGGSIFPSRLSCWTRPIAMTLVAQSMTSG